MLLLRRWWQFCLSARQCTGASCIQHSPTAAMQNSQLITVQGLTPLTTRFIGSHIQQHEYQYEVPVTRLNKLSQRLVEVWQCSNTTFEWKDAIFVFLPVLRNRSAEALVRKIKTRLIAYFLSNISAENCRNRFILLVLVNGVDSLGILEGPKPVVYNHRSNFKCCLQKIQLENSMESFNFILSTCGVIFSSHSYC